MACPAPGMPSPSSYPDSHGRREAKHPETIIPSPSAGRDKKNINGELRGCSDNITDFNTSEF